MDLGNDVSGLSNIFNVNTESAESMKDGDKKDAAVAANFASIFVNEMLQSSRKDGLSDGEGSFFDSEQSDMSKKMYYQQMSQAITHENGFGITQMIQQAIASGERKT